MQVVVTPNMKIGRNDKCHCESGKKYKKCCLMRDERKPHETLAKFVGNEWIETELGKIRLDGYNKYEPYEFGAHRYASLDKSNRWYADKITKI